MSRSKIPNRGWYMIPGLTNAVIVPNDDIEQSEWWNRDKNNNHAFMEQQGTITTFWKQLVSNNHFKLKSKLEEIIENKTQLVYTSTHQRDQDIFRDVSVYVVSNGALRHEEII